FLFRFIKIKRRPKVFDLGLIGVLPEYESRGVASAMIAGLCELMLTEGAEHFETNLMLEDNAHILNMLKHFEKTLHKKKRCYKIDVK
ncbi:MAG: GNAT family N-acetyltransferase, partial [Clostridia bacterium]|nr:GNAT family N-acetyltransferase [Clostridia bacterium]